MVKQIKFDYDKHLPNHRELNREMHTVFTDQKKLLMLFCLYWSKSMDDHIPKKKKKLRIPLMIL